MKLATANYLNAYRETELCGGRKPLTAQRDLDARTTKSLKDHRVKELRKELCEVFGRFLRRCYKVGLIEIERLHEIEKSFGIFAAK